jgi:hypothetical protein
MLGHAEGTEEVQQARIDRRYAVGDRELDFVFETSLCHVAEKQAARCS